MASFAATLPPPTPWQRLTRMLDTERKTIRHIIFYAVVTGLVSLSLPLGTQAVFNLVSTGAVFGSTYLLIGVVVGGVLLASILLIGQLTMVEAIEQRLFAKAAIEFAYRLPRIKPEALAGQNPPELVNRFFDVLTVQKGLTKLLIDLMFAGMQILFGALVLAFYHPIFIALGLFTIIALVLIYCPELPAGTAHQHCRIGLQVRAGGLAGAGGRPPARGARRPRAAKTHALTRADELTADYLHARNAHFQVLKTYYGYAMALRTLLTAGLLVAGTLFVVSRQMTLGQFVAAEVLIVQISGSIEKLMTGMSTIFDILTGVEKWPPSPTCPLTLTTPLLVMLNLSNQHVAAEVWEKVPRQSRPELLRTNGSRRLSRILLVVGIAVSGGPVSALAADHLRRGHAHGPHPAGPPPNRAEPDCGPHRALERARRPAGAQGRYAAHASPKSRMSISTPTCPSACASSWPPSAATWPPTGPKLRPPTSRLPPCAPRLEVQLASARNRWSRPQTTWPATAPTWWPPSNFYQTSQARLARYEEGYKNGLFSLTDIETRRLKLQEDLAKVTAQRNKLASSQQSLANARIELANLRAKYGQDLAKTMSDRSSAVSSQASSEGEVAALRNKISNVEVAARPVRGARPPNRLRRAGPEGRHRRNHQGGRIHCHAPARSPAAGGRNVRAGHGCAAHSARAAGAAAVRWLAGHPVFGLALGGSGHVRGLRVGD